MYISSDSDDDCYGNIPEKLEKLLTKRRAESKNVLEKKCTDEMVDLCDVTFNSSNVFSKDEVIVVPDSEDKKFDSANLFLSEPIVVPDEIPRKLGSKRKKAIETPTKRGAKRGRGRGRGKKSQSFEAEPIVSESQPMNNQPRRFTRATLRGNTSVDNFVVPLAPEKTKSARGRGRKRGKNAVITDRDTDSPIQISSTEASPIPNQIQNPTQDSGISLDYQIALALAFGAPSRGSRRVRDRRSGGRVARSQYVPTYSIGNTEEYPDASDNIKLFTNKPHIPITPTTDLNDSINNEELSVKVFWQSSKVVKFNIRKLQKLSQIFDHFVKEEGVSKDQLLFTYNNKILRPDDTPDSIDYNIAKFIDGGITNSEIYLPQPKEPVRPVTKGFKLKFQCQKLKKPYEVAIGKEERLNLAMVKCAEHLEISIAELRFEFDGETITGNMTPKDLEMDSGDCIDVKILNVNK